MIEGERTMQEHTIIIIILEENTPREGDNIRIPWWILCVLLREIEGCFGCLILPYSCSKFAFGLEVDPTKKKLE